MRLRTRLTATATAAAVALTLAACGDDTETTTGNGAGDVATVEPAAPADSPPQEGTPAGVVVPAAPGSALAVSGTRVAVLGTDGSVALHTAPGAMDTPPPITVDLPQVTALVSRGDGFLAAAPGRLATIARDGAVTELAEQPGTVLSLAVTADDRVLAGTSDGHLYVRAADGALQRDIHNFVAVDEVVVAPETSPLAGQVVVVDRAQSSVTPVDIDTGEIKAALRAGNGVTEAIDDSYGRVLVANTRDNEVIGFYGQPIVMRFRFPAGPSPYARGCAPPLTLFWVSTTGNNLAIAYDLSSGEPRERARIATVGQVSAMATDPANGMLYLLSGRDGGLQVVSRTAVEAAQP